MAATAPANPFSTNDQHTRWSTVRRADAWTSREARWYAWLLLPGSLLPFLLNGLFSSGPRWAFPWNLCTAELWPLAALSLVSAAGFAWFCLAQRVRRIRPRSLLLLTGGSATLVGATLLPFGQEAVLVGAPYLLADASEKAFLLVVALASACLAAGNRLRSTAPSCPLARWALLGGALTVVAAYGLPLGEDGAPVLWSCRPAAWQDSWPLAVTLTAILAYGLLGLVGGLTRHCQRAVKLSLSLFPRVLLAWIPVAFFLLQRDESWYAFFVARDALSVTLATVKLCSVVYGALFLTTVGLAGWLAKTAWDRTHPQRRKNPECDPAPMREPVAQP